MKKMFLSALALFGVLGLQAQSNTVSGGGNATGNGGTVSFTVGQVAYTAASGNGGSVSQGVQQVYTVSIPSNVRDLDINLNAQIYPNPTTDQLLLTLTGNEYKQLNYQLLDLQGKVLRQNQLNNTTTSIDVAQLPNGTYFIRVLDKQRQLKTFQIIKNK
ncbi:MAG: T9SS type A sorting domain-containing protein [Bacteroidota bacterium]